MTYKTKLYTADRVKAHPYYARCREHGYSVVAAFYAVKRMDYFRADLAATVKRDKARSKAAKKGHATRRAMVSA